ncbi:MAG: VanZ family protein [Candidatus Aminicenantes bacterium]|nr:VanZ family protein [Candidatus Aminicenantes bacterium]
MTAFGIWFLGITFVSMAPGSMILDKFGATGKHLGSPRLVEHTTAYFVGSVLCFYTFSIRKYRFLFFSSVMVFFYGLFLEIIQIGIPYRAFNLHDIAANGIGVVLFMIGEFIYLSIFIHK